MNSPRRSVALPDDHRSYTQDEQRMMREAVQSGVVPVQALDDVQPETEELHDRVRQTLPDIFA